MTRDILTNGTRLPGRREPRVQPDPPTCPSISRWEMGNRDGERCNYVSCRGHTLQFVCQLFTLSSSTRGHCRLCSKALTVAHQRQIVDFVS